MPNIRITVCKVFGGVFSLSVRKCILSLTQPHKTGLMRRGLHPLIYYERL